MTVVAVLGLNPAIGFELMIPGQVFGMANLAEDEPRASCVAKESMAPASRPPRYEVRVCSRARSLATVPEWGATEIRTPFGLEGVADADVILVPGTQAFLEQPHPEVIEVLKDAAKRGARIAAVCVGAFTVAAAGLLDGRRVTTHWQWTGELARRHPSVEVDPSVLFVDTGQFLTSAGIASGIDLCLHLIRADAGADLAARTARRLVVPAWRDGGQAQYMEHLDPVDANSTLHSTIMWMERNVGGHLNLEAIAKHASISVRSLNRQFRTHVGTTPMQLLLQLRVDRARQLLESTRLPMSRIAEASGFGSHASLRYHFVRLVGTAPQSYRSSYLARGVGAHSMRATQAAAGGF